MTTTSWSGRWPRRLPHVVLLVLVVLASCSRSGDSRAKTTTATKVATDTEEHLEASVLLSVTAQGARVDDGGGSLSLVLSQPASRTVWFADRPVRAAGSYSTSNFPEIWQALGFGGDPPNAAITGTVADGQVVNRVVELSKPELSGGALRFDVDADVASLEPLEDVSLFVDGGSSNYVTFSGDVLDSDGEPVSGASVTVTGDGVVTVVSVGDDPVSGTDSSYAVPVPCSGTADYLLLAADGDSRGDVTRDDVACPSTQTVDITLD